MPSITGTTGNDVINGTQADDTINGGGGNDTIVDRWGDDIIDGGDGDDVIIDEAGNNTIRGGAGNDRITISDVYSLPGSTTGNPPRTSASAIGTAWFTSSITSTGITGAVRMICSIAGVMVQRKSRANAAAAPNRPGCG